MIKRNFLLGLVIIFLSGSVHGNYYSDLLKKFIPSWRTLSYIVSGIALLKGLQKINDNWHWNHYCDDGGDFHGSHFIVKRRNRVNHSDIHGANAIVSVTNKNFTFPVRYLDVANHFGILADPDSTASVVEYSATLKKFWGMMNCRLLVVTKHADRSEKVMVYKHEWPSQKDFRKGLLLMGSGAALFLGTGAYQTLSKRNLLKAL